MIQKGEFIFIKDEFKEKQQEVDVFGATPTAGLPKSNLHNINIKYKI